jgi:hypothetical protein
MRTHGRSFARRLGRGLLLVTGVMGGLAVVDAVLLFVFFLVLVPTLVASPYIGLVLVGLPFVAIVGGALAVIAYVVLSDGAPSPSNDDHHVRV